VNPHLVESLQMERLGKRPLKRFRLINFKSREHINSLFQGLSTCWSFMKPVLTATWPNITSLEQRSQFNA